MEKTRKLLALILALSLVLPTFNSVYAATPQAVSDVTKSVVCEKHVGKTVIKTATTKKDGKSTSQCTTCGEVLAESKIPKIGEIVLSKEIYSYNGKAKKPKIYVFDKSGLLLKNNVDYTVKYAKGRKKCGKYKITVEFKGNYTGKKTAYFKILPKSTEIKEIKTTSSTKVNLKWKKVSGASGYQIQYSTSSNFKKNLTTKTVKSAKKLSYTLKNLKKGKTYYFRIRTYKKEKTKVYSEWSSAESIKPSRHGYSVKKLLNTEKLKPMKTNDKALDKLIDKTFKKIHKPGMSTYEKVKACYDYLVDKMKYGTQFAVFDSEYLSFYDSMLVTNAYSILSTKVGVCDNYSAAFVVMCRRLGLEAYTDDGTVSKKGGGRTGHAWTYIVLNGKKYIFDPQVQSDNKGTPYYYFGKTYSQMGDTYKSDGGNEAAFCNFTLAAAGQEKIKDLNCKVTVKGQEDEENFDATLEKEISVYTSGVEGLFDQRLKSYSNGFVKIEIEFSGGSGNYEAVLFDQKSSDIIYDFTTTKKSVVWNVDLSRFKSKNVTFDLMIMNGGNSESYIIFEGIKLKRV